MSGGFPHSHMPLLSLSPHSFGVPHHSSGESDSGSFSDFQRASGPTDEQLDQPFDDAPFVPPPENRRRPEFSDFTPDLSQSQGYSNPPQQYVYNPERYPAYDANCRRVGMEPRQWRTGHYRDHPYPSGDLSVPEPYPHSGSSSSSQSHFPSPNTAFAPHYPQAWPDPGPELRRQMHASPTAEIGLWSLPDPPPGQKPGHALPMLIKLAIYGSPRKMLTLQEIYATLENRFEWFRENRDDKAWKNSIRHNLSLNKVFRAVARPITEPGKGSYWRVDMSDGEGHKRPRKRKGKGKTTRMSTDDEDEYDVQFPNRPGSSVGTDDPHVSGRQERSRRTSPYPLSSPTTESRSSLANPWDINRIPRRPRSNSESPSPQSTSSSSHDGSPHYMVPLEPPPVQGPARFQNTSSSSHGGSHNYMVPIQPLPVQGPTRLDQPAFGQSSFGQPSFRPPFLAHPLLGHASAAATSSVVSSTSFPSAFMPSQAGHVSLGPVGDTSGHHHVARPAVTHDRYAPVVVPPPRPGVEIVGGPGLPSARRIQVPHDPNTYYVSPFSSESHVAHSEHSQANMGRTIDPRGKQKDQE